MAATGIFAALAPGILAGLLSAGAQEQQEKPTEAPEKRLALSKKNAAAEELESLALGLGLDAHRNLPSAEHPTREDLEAWERTGIASWLDAQLRTADDSIASVPESIRNFFERRQPTLWRVVGLLERDVPLWESDPRAEARDLSGPALASRLAKILTAAALVEERAGHHVQAGDCLEASWSLSQSFSGQRDLLSQLFAVTLGKLQAGALRKISEPPVQWLDRMSGVEPWGAMLDAVEPKPHASERNDNASPDESQKAYVRAWHIVTDRLRALSPCEVSKLSEDEIWKPARDEVEQSQQSQDDPSVEPIPLFVVPNITRAIRRAGRLLVDRELTARILEVKQEKAWSSDGRWPVKFSDLDSRVCPGASYEYQSRGTAFAIRFKGPMDADEGPALVLPLFFEVRAPRPTPTPTRSRRPTVTPRPRA